MRIALPIITLLFVALAHVGDARADDDLEDCVNHAKKWLATKPPIKTDSDVWVLSPTRLVYRCSITNGLPEGFVAAVRGSGGWKVTGLDRLYCAKVTVSKSGLEIEHGDSCPMRYYHPNACVDFRSRVTFSKGKPTLTRLSSKRRPACQYCPDSTKLGCVKRARSAAKKLFTAGKVRAAASLLRGVLDHVEDYALNSSETIDPWAINDAMFYSARAKIPCVELAETWRNHAVRTPRSRAAFVANSQRCKRVKPKR